MSTKKKPEVITPEVEEVIQIPGQDQIIHAEISKFALVLTDGERVDPRKKIAEWKAGAKDLTIIDLNDKEGYQKVDKYWKAAWKRATAIENRRKELKQSYLNIGQAIDKEAKELISLINEIKEPLMNKARWYEAEQERIKQEAIEAAKERLRARAQRLLDLRFAFDGQDYVYRCMKPSLNPKAVGLSSTQIEVYSDEDFNAYVEKITPHVEEDQAYIAELQAIADRQAAEEAERVRKEQEAKEKELAELRAKVAAIEAKEAAEKPIAPEAKIHPMIPEYQIVIEAADDHTKKRTMTGTLQDTALKIALPQEIFRFLNDTARCDPFSATIIMDGVEYKIGKTGFK
jgi:hypothetical protein